MKPSFEFFNMLILFLAFVLKLVLKINIHVACFDPLPTLPLNWCNWDRPNLLAFSIMIKFAFGKSIPTSIIVVDTNILYSLFRNLFNIISLFV